MVCAGDGRSKDLDVEMATGYVSGMKRTLGDYLTIGIIVLVMCTTLAGMGNRIHMAVAGG